MVETTIVSIEIDYSFVLLTSLDRILFHHDFRKNYCCRLFFTQGKLL